MKSESLKKFSDSTDIVVWYVIRNGAEEFVGKVSSLSITTHSIIITFEWLLRIQRIIETVDDVKKVIIKPIHRSLTLGSIITLNKPEIKIEDNVCFCDTSDDQEVVLLIAPFEIERAQHIREMYDKFTKST